MAQSRYADEAMTLSNLLRCHMHSMQQDRDRGMFMSIQGKQPGDCVMQTCR
ncbi:hypothetical protein BIFGAL_03077 [Bifidobacterium gallicum DSM 20093 = LMG 11596]|uniref:Uncharacterized protein n=1 Tax=Bifidobacterium gallicum DSM 20093 = LMG 11596 TaxID=561180 RepID=D1NTC0_9BIFI|nr:hypothetical protein BIFGAL_03077 [Bifidobacterium gallicum DSM 20093 = LMG 11596]